MIYWIIWAIKQVSKRKEVNAFFIEWLTGCTHVSIGLDARILNFTEKNPDLLIIFMTGWTKQVLNTNDNKDRVKGNLAGVEAVIEFYLKNKDYLKKDKNVEKYIKMRDKGKLEEHIESMSKMFDLGKQIVSVIVRLLSNK